ncbi:TetR/AcrR family transcriptional regulator [Clostridiaceae bacterium M8S5]|nr:TetR/AcrR family transcriptional regulator [Clostridiaceae bacterium M8S5]
MERMTRKSIKILDCSIQLFMEYGIKKVTMNDIAKRSNVSKMTIYKYFNDKETLYKYVGKTMLERCYEELEELYELSEDVVQKMIKCTYILTDYISKGYATLCFELGNYNDEINKEVKQFNMKVKDIIIVLIKEGKQNKLIREDISDECIYHYIDMGLNYFQHNAEYRKKIINDSSFRRNYMAFIWGNVFIDYSGFDC